MSYELGDATRGPNQKGGVNCERRGARVLRRMARGAVEKAAGRNAKAVRGGGGRSDGGEGGGEGGEVNASTGGEGGRIFLFLGCGLEDATRGPIPEGEKNCGQGAARVLRRMARGAVGMSAGRNAKAVRGEGGGRRRDGPQGLRCGTGKGGGGCGWRATEAGKLLVSTVWAMTHAAWNAIVHALIGNTGAPTCHGSGGVGHYKRLCPERGRMPGSRRGKVAPHSGA